MLFELDSNIICSRPCAGRVSAFAKTRCGSSAIHNPFNIIDVMR